MLNGLIENSKIHTRFPDMGFQFYVWFETCFYEVKYLLKLFSNLKLLLVSYFDFITKIDTSYSKIQNLFLHFHSSEAEMEESSIGNDWQLN